MAVNAGARAGKAVRLTLEYTKAAKVFGKPLLTSIRNNPVRAGRVATLAGAGSSSTTEFTAHARDGLDNAKQRQAKCG